MNDIVQLITTVGFPIIAALLVGKYVVELNKQHREDIATITKTNNDKMDEMTKAIQNNTIVMTRICERLGEKNGIAEENHEAVL